MKLASACLLLVLCAQAPKPRELFENGGFEQGLHGWRTLDQSGTTHFDIDPSVKHEGKQSLRIERGKGDKLDFLKGFLDLPVREGSLSVALAYKLDKDAHAAGTVYFYDRDGKEVGKGFLALFDARKPTQGFEVVRKTFEIPRAALGLGINVLVDRPGKTWIDAVSVTAVLEPGGKSKTKSVAKPGALENAGFEDGARGWVELAGGSGTLKVEARAAGGGVLRLARASPRTFPVDAVAQTLEDLGDARRWKLAAQARVSGSARAAVLMVAFDSAGVPRESVRGVFGPPAEKEEFARVALELVLAEPRERLSVQLLVEGQGAADFDTLELGGR